MCNQSFTDIHVEAFVRDRRILQLNITLLNKMPSPYDVTVELNSQNESNHCLKVNHCALHGVAQVRLRLNFKTNTQINWLLAHGRIQQCWLFLKMEFLSLITNIANFKTIVLTKYRRKLSTEKHWLTQFTLSKVKSKAQIQFKFHFKPQ